MAANGRGKDNGLSVLEQYDLISENTYRGRGTLLCETQQGLKMIRPYSGSAKRLEKINQVLEHLGRAGLDRLDLTLKNKEEQLVSTDKEGYSYQVKNWWNAKECDVRSEVDILRCMQYLAQLHEHLFLEIEGGCESENLTLEYEKHNRQMKKIRTYIRRRKQKTPFEYLYLESVEHYLEYGERASEYLEETHYGRVREMDIKKGSICHGACNQHNFLMLEDQVVLVNFDHFFLGNHMGDVAQFLRKIMEKHGWNPHLAHRMLEAYDHTFRITKEQFKQLRARMLYPEKYWKISNFYYNNNKAFLPEKNMEKLKNILHQEDKWNSFLNSIFPINP